MPGLFLLDPIDREESRPLFGLSSERGGFAQSKTALILPDMARVILYFPQEFEI
jgi:hypothetical protein